MAQLQLYVCKFNHLTHTHTYTHRAELHVIYTHNLQTDTQVCTHQISLSLSLMLTDSEKLNMQTKTRSSAPYGSAVNLKWRHAKLWVCHVRWCTVFWGFYGVPYTHTQTQDLKTVMSAISEYTLHIPTSFFLSFSHLTKACWAVTANYALLNQCCYCNTTQSDRILSNEY